MLYRGNKSGLNDEYEKNYQHSFTACFIDHTHQLGANFAKGFAAYKSGDYETALGEWMPLAEQGNANAQYNLGQMYNKGEGVLQNYKTAAK